jgi:hypothetical protein
MPLQTTAVMAPAVPGRRHRVDRWFYISAGVFMALLSVAAFGPSIVDPSRRSAPLTALATAHGVVTAVWILLFLTQATLVATGRTALHRRRGRLAPALAALLVLLGCLTVVGNARRGYDLSGDIDRGFDNPCANRGCPDGVTPEGAVLFASFALPVTEAFVWFGALAAAGLLYRRRPEVHKRLMLLGVLSLAGAPLIHVVGRLSVWWPDLQGRAFLVQPLAILLLGASAAHDKATRGRVHPVSLWVPVLRVAWVGLVSAVMFWSDWWREFAAWVLR